MLFETHFYATSLRKTSTDWPFNTWDKDLDTTIFSTKDLNTINPAIDNCKSSELTALTANEHVDVFLVQFKLYYSVMGTICRAVFHLLFFLLFLHYSLTPQALGYSK